MSVFSSASPQLHQEGHTSYVGLRSLSETCVFPRKMSWLPLEVDGLAQYPKIGRPPTLILTESWLCPNFLLKGLVLGCIEAEFLNQILVGKLWTRSIRFTCALWEKRSEIENEILIMKTYTGTFWIQSENHEKRFWEVSSGRKTMHPRRNTREETIGPHRLSRPGEKIRKRARGTLLLW